MATAPVSAAVATGSASAPPPLEQPWLEKTLRAADPRFEGWLADAASLRLQILVTAVDPDSDRWTTYEFRPDAEYFYPASAIKTFLAVATLRALDEKLGAEVPLATRIERCREDRPGCEPPDVDEDKDKEKEEGDDKKRFKKLRIGEEIAKMLSYSDNDSYNRLYDIVGHEELNRQMAALGFTSVRFHHRMDAPAERSRRTVRVRLIGATKRGLEIKPKTSTFEPAPTSATGLDIGTAYNDGRKRIEGPMSFAKKNYVSLREMQAMNMSLLFPKHAGTKDLGLSEGERAHLIRSMTANLEQPANAAEHNPLSPGVLDEVPAKAVRYIGKSGRAYGFHLDNAFIQSTTSKKGFFVTVTVYSNPDGVLNDDDYGYDETTRPLLAALGKALAQALL